MADFSSILQRDYGLKPQSKLPPMNAPRSAAGIVNSNVGINRVGPMAKGRSGADGTGGSAASLLGDGLSEGSLPFVGKGSLPPNRASFGKAAEETFAGSAVAYDDVFGGPPRYASSMFASSQVPVPTLDEVFRVPARTQSFKGSSLPVFELPVFGDEVFGGSSYTPRPATLAYEDIFNEAATPSALPPMNIGPFAGASRSKPSSRSSSRRLSPVHPSASADSSSVQDEVLPALSAAEITKPRSAASKFIRRSSFSSFSSFDETVGKPPDSPFTAIRDDTVASSLPSSPPRTNHWDHLKRPPRAHSGSSVRPHGNGFNMDIDDVFGGFPQRSSLVSSRPFSDVRREATRNDEAMSSMRTYGTGAFDKPLVKRNIPGSEFGVGCSSVDNDEIPGSIDPSFPSSPSSTDEQGLQEDFIEIRMDRHNDSCVLENVNDASRKSWVTVKDVNLFTRPSSKPPPSRPPPAPATQLKFKSWKDWAAEFPASHSASFSSPTSVDSTSADSHAEGTNAAACTVTAEMDESGHGDALYFEEWEAVSISPSEHQPESCSDSISAAAFKDATVRSKRRSKSAKETVEMEERELQAMLANAWKINEERQMGIKAAQLAQDIQGASEESEKELHWKEWRRHLNRQAKAVQSVQKAPEALEEREKEIHRKDWRRHANRERDREVPRDKIANEKAAQKGFQMSEHDASKSQDRSESTAARRAAMGTEESVFMEEKLKVAADRLSTNSSVSATQLSSVGRDDREVERTMFEDPVEALERTERIVEGQLQGRSNYSEKIPSVSSPVVGSAAMQKPTVQDSVQDVEQNEPLEDFESFLGLASTLDGFQEIEGESLERRKSRWERHVRARQRSAKALEEKQQRDAEAEREQAEKHQLAETSDYQIKRWATGKEGNLRALLSNLQHVLWPESGWQPIHLTDLIEGAAVKKAYRKATLFVHPDKVQQKGATLPQRYVAGRVFDILQEAWKTFNTQELF